MTEDEVYSLIGNTVMFSEAEKELFKQEEEALEKVHNEFENKRERLSKSNAAQKMSIQKFVMERFLAKNKGLEMKGYGYSIGGIFLGDIATKTKAFFCPASEVDFHIWASHMSSRPMTSDRSDLFFILVNTTQKDLRATCLSDHAGNLLAITGATPFTVRSRIVEEEWSPMGWSFRMGAVKATLTLKGCHQYHQEGTSAVTLGSGLRLSYMDGMPLEGPLLPLVIGPKSIIKEMRNVPT
jgi:hypothetical protein